MITVLKNNLEGAMFKNINLTTNVILMLEYALGNLHNKNNKKRISYF